MELLAGLAQNLACRATTPFQCGTDSADDASPTTEDTVTALTTRFLHFDAPIPTVSDSLYLDSAALAVGGASEANLVSEQPGTLFGAGYLSARFFLLTADSACWTIAVEATNDSPPPVKLDLFVDSEMLATLAYERGDQSRESQEIAARLKPGLHRLDIVFVNDFFDDATGQDRNAYIHGVTLTRADAMEACP